MASEAERSFQIRLLTRKGEMLPHYFLIRQLSPGISEERYATLLDEMVPQGYRP